MLLPDPDRWKLLSPRIDELLLLDGVARSERLAELASSDSSLADELTRLLAHQTSLQHKGFLAGSAASSVDLEHGLAGLEVGAYVLSSPLGQGGSGSVWRARRNDGRHEGEVAVKLLHMSLLGHAAAERFRREGAILARLIHPNIAGLLDAGLTPAGQPFMVLELVEGEAIDVHCDRLALDTGARLRLFLDVLSAVSHAHRHLVVHRDLKPTNVFVTAEGRVKLLDFGIAKLIDADSEADGATELTREGGRALTPEYAAPEQFLGGEVTTATDVYALGVVLFKLLGGRHPTPCGRGSPSRMLQAVVEQDPARLSRFDTRSEHPSGGRPDNDAIAAKRSSTLAKLGKQLAGDLDNILAKTLRKLPAERYASVDALAEDLRRHLAHQPISVRVDAWSYRAAKFFRRHRTAALGVAVSLLTMLAGVIGTAIQARNAHQQSLVAARERDQALRELTYAEAANEFIGNVLTEGSRRPTSSVGLLDQADALLEAQFADAPALRLRMQLMLATMYVELTEERKALALLDRALPKSERSLAAVDSDKRLRVDCLAASLREDLPALDRAMARYTEIPGAGASEQKAQRQASAYCLTRRSIVLRRAGRLEEAAADARHSLALIGVPSPGQSLPTWRRHWPPAWQPKTTPASEARGLHTASRLARPSLCEAEHRSSSARSTKLGHPLPLRSNTWWRPRGRIRR